MVAAIAEGHADLADVLFLVGFVLALLAGLLAFAAAPVTRCATAMLSFAVSLVALAFFVL